MPKSREIRHGVREENFGRAISYQASSHESSFSPTKHNYPYKESVLLAAGFKGGEG